MDGGNNDYPVRLTETAIVVPVVVMMTHMVPVAEFAMPRGLMKAAIAMIEALCVRGGHGQAQCGNQCQCKQFFA
jgi:hypothetical protein